VDKVSGQLKIESSELTISEISKHLQAEKAAELKLVQEKMVDVLGRLKNSNELNSRIDKKLS
jgi:uncharacterized coiled-coil protein SlyX